MSGKLAHIDEANFAQEVEQSAQPVVVDFYAEWCGPCKMISPILESLASDMEGKVKIVKVDIDQNPQLALRFGVQSIPNLLFFKGGEVVDQVVGFGGRDALTAKVNSLASA
jgi:thioredoxin 1